MLVNKWHEGFRRRGVTVRAGAEAVEQVADSDPLEEMAEEEYRRYLVARALQLMQAEFSATTWKACWETTAGGKTPAEAAAELGISVRAVYLARIRVLKRLREELEGLME